MGGFFFFFNDMSYAPRLWISQHSDIPEKLGYRIVIINVG